MPVTRRPRGDKSVSAVDKVHFKVYSWLDGDERSPRWTCTHTSLGDGLTDAELGADPDILNFTQRLSKAAEAYEKDFPTAASRTEEEWMKAVKRARDSVTQIRDHPQLVIGRLTTMEAFEDLHTQNGTRVCDDSSWPFPGRDPNLDHSTE